VIKDRLDETGPIRTAPTAAGQGAGDGTPPAGPADAAAVGDAVDDTAPGTATSERRNGVAAAAPDDRPGPEATPARAAEPTPGASPPSPVGDDPTLQLPTVAGGSRSAARPPRDKSGADGATGSLTTEELAQASGLSQRAVRELEGYGLLTTHMVGDASFYDADALVIAKVAGELAAYGIEPRHLRAFKTAADREVGLMEQVVSPIRRSREESAEGRAAQLMDEMAVLSVRLHAALVKAGLRSLR
jgi:hypothetical protein